MISAVGSTTCATKASCRRSTPRSIGTVSWVRSIARRLGRALHRYDPGHGHQGPRFGAAECRLLSRHGRQEGHHPVPPLARAELGTTLRQVRGKRRADAGRVCVRMGAHLAFCAASPIPPHISEFDVMGAMRGKPVDLVSYTQLPILSCFHRRLFVVPFASFASIAVNKFLQ